jgi:hypothetical protein
VASPPYSFDWENAPAGLHPIIARAYDDAGASADSEAVLIVVGTPAPVALLVVANPDALNAADAGVQGRLESLGFEVALQAHNLTATADALGKSLIVVSSTVSSGQVGTKYRDVAVPVINWEQALQDDFLMTWNTGADRGEDGGHTEVIIVDPDHPLAAGLPAGIHTVTTSPQIFTWGRPNPLTAHVIATVATGADTPCVYAYEKGALLIDGSTPAPERRVHIFLQDNTFASLTPDGLKLFDAAVNWAVGGGTAPPARFDSATLENGAITITWSGEGTLEEAPTVRGPWSALPNAASPYSVPAVNQAKFFRLAR